MSDAIEMEMLGNGLVMQISGKPTYRCEGLGHYIFGVPYANATYL